MGGILPVTSLTSLDMSFFNRVVGLGRRRRRRPRRSLDEVLAFYDGLGPAEHVSVSLVASAPSRRELEGWLGDRGFVATQPVGEMLAADRRAAPVATDLRIEEVGPEARRCVRLDLSMDGVRLAAARA